MSYFISIIVSLFLTTNAFAIDGKHGPIESDSGIQGPRYADLEVYFAELEAAYPWMVERIIYGQSVRGRNLNALKLKYKNIQVPGAPMIVISGSTHGDEYLNIVDRLPQWFIEQGLQNPAVEQFLASGGEILLIPILNPDGYESRRRRNANNIDLNRDFDNLKANYKGFTQPETIYLTRMIANEVTSQQLRLAATVDYHCCSGDFLYPYSYRGPVMPQKDLERYDIVRRISLEVFGDQIGYGTTPTLLGYDAIGTSKDYYYETYGSASFTFEGRYSQENRYFETHAQFWVQMMSAISQGML